LPATLAPIETDTPQQGRGKEGFKQGLRPARGVAVDSGNQLQINQIGIVLFRIYMDLEYKIDKWKNKALHECKAFRGCQ